MGLESAYNPVSNRRNPRIVQRSNFIYESDKSGQKPSLPESYTNVPATYMNDKEPVPRVAPTEKEFQGELSPAIAKEKCWIEHSMNLLSADKLQKGQAFTWATYHTSLQPISVDPCVITALLPLFMEKADSPAMVKHGLNILKNLTQFLNPGQIPVLACDCPIFAVCKRIQWTFPQTHGEDKFLTMFGGLHIEKALLCALGKLLRGSGLTHALTEAEIASSGTADSFINVSHITRTRHAHQVTAMALYKLQEDAYASVGVPEELRDEEQREKWRIAMVEKSATFRFWDLVLRAELLVLIFIRAHREKNFSLYVESLESLMFLFFALDHNNYRRWLPVHIRDMKALPSGIRENFPKCFSASKTSARFSAIPLDQVHEQENAKVKARGGAVGLTENLTAFRRWMVAGPEQARFVTQFERDYIYLNQNLK